jgi:hypothetical protein
MAQTKHSFEKQRNILLRLSPTRHARLVPWKRYFSLPGVFIDLDRVAWTVALETIINSVEFPSYRNTLPVTEIRLIELIRSYYGEDGLHYRGRPLRMLPAIDQHLSNY